MIPLFFGNANKQLFGIIHKPVKLPASKTGVIICYPFGQEYIRSHRSVRQLSKQIARVGFYVLRFDYYGTGDSLGQGYDANLEQWKSDIITAMKELQRRFGIEKIILIGVRLGASLALMVSNDTRDVAGLVMWEPILNGENYLREIKESHAEWFECNGKKHKLKLEERQNEVLGFPLTTQLKDDITSIKTEKISFIKSSRTLIISSEEKQEAAKFSQLLKGAVDSTSTKAGNHISYQFIPGVKPWLKHEGFDKMLVPQPILQAIIKWISDNFS